MNHKEYQEAAEYWNMKDVESVKMERSELLLIEEDYIQANNTCALATGSGSFVRCTSNEYMYRGGAFWMFSEGGQKFAALENNHNVCLAIMKSLNFVKIVMRNEKYSYLMEENSKWKNGIYLMKKDNL